MGQTLPTLSVYGWVDNKNMLMTKLFEHFLAAEQAQSVIHKGNISSLKYIIANNKEQYDIQKEIEKSLLKLYQPYYTTVTVTVLLEDNTSIPDSIEVYSIGITATSDKGEKYVLAKEIHKEGALVKNFEELLTDMHNMYLNKH